MKKYFLVVLCMVLLFAVTGCGKKQVKCSRSFTEDGMTMTGEVIADLDGSDKITDVTIVYDIGDQKTADAYCGLMKLGIDESKGQSVSCSGTKITIKGLDSFEETEDSEKIIGITKDEFVKLAEEDEFTCK